MLHYLYLDYGGRAQYRRELKYSLISLREELGQEPGARIAVYTDAPAVYAHWPVEVVDISAQTQAWSGGGVYHHRIKPAVVLDALRRFAAPVCLLDSDSIVRPGFHAEVSAKLAPQETWSVTKTAVVMNRFELRNPCPPLKGFRTSLPHLGQVRYDTANSWMFNSGLIGVAPVHVPLLEDTLAYIDALIGRARKFPTIEQLALERSGAAVPDADCRSARQLPALLAGTAAHLYGQPESKRACHPTGMTWRRPRNGRR